MSLLRDLQESAAGTEMSLSELLRRLKILGVRLRLPELESWVDSERSGYQDIKTLPSYRGPFEAPVVGDFGGPFGSGLENAPIPRLNFPEKYRDGVLFKLIFMQAVGELEVMAGKSELYELWPADALVIVNYMLQTGELHLYENMGLRYAKKVIGPTLIPGIVEAVRNRILDFLLNLEQVAPTAGEGDEPPPHGPISQVFHNTFYGGTNIAVGGHHTQQSATFPASGNVEALLSWLRDHDVPDDEVATLSDAILEDANDATVTPGSPGPHVSAWLGRIAMHGAAAIGTGTTVEIVTELIKRFFGF